MRSRSSRSMLVDHERLADDRADRLARVQRRVRVLEDHLHLAPQRHHLACATASRCRGPRSTIEPLVGSSSRSSSRAVVDLPQPDSPTMPSVSPRITSNETPSTARTAPIWRWKHARADREVLHEVADLDRASRRSCGLGLASGAASGGSSSALASARPSRGSASGASPPRERVALVRLQRLPDRAPLGARQQARHRVPRVALDRLERGSIPCAPRARTGSADGMSSPTAAVISDGGRPAIGTSSSSRGGSRRGIERSRPHVYGCSGAPKIVVVGRARRPGPAYMTAISSATSATTPRSWVISTTAVSSSLCRRSISSRICACTVTSSAVVGSSAISSLGSLIERHRDHHALAHAARELVRVAVDAPARIGDPDQAEHLDRAVARLRLGHVAVGADRLDQLVADLVEGMQRRQRVLEDHRDVVAAQRAHLVVAGLQQVAARRTGSRR